MNVRIDMKTVVIVVLLAFVVVKGCERSDDGREPDVVVPKLATDDAAEAYLRVYARRLGDIYEESAKAIADGRIQSDSQLFDFTVTTQVAREESRQAFDAACEREIPDGEWDTSVKIAAAERACRDAAAGFRRVQR